jgi:hypothetical protein
MGDDQYINRLVDWITSNATSATLRDAVISDLEYLGRRLDAFADAGHKGAHDDVSRFDASRFLVGTYVLLGDLLRLRPATTAAPPPAGVGAPPELPPSPPPLTDSARSSDTE